MNAKLMALGVAALAGCGGGSGTPPETPGADMKDMPGMAAAGPGDMSMAVAGDGPIRLTARQAQLAGVTFAVAREAPVERTVRAVAMAVPNERGLGIVNARISGWVEGLHANETGRWVHAGDPLLDLYAPELVTGQEELLLATRLAATGAAGGDSLVAAARRRLALWDIDQEEIAAIETSGHVTRRLMIRSPFTGHILAKDVVEGQMVRPGDPLFRIADLSTIWIEPAIFESDISLIRIGQSAEVTFDALPTRRFDGRVTFISPELDITTRTLKVRIEVPNRHFRIKPMMYGAVRITTAGPPGVMVPLGAILSTGTRDLAFVLRDGGVQPTEVVVGARGDATIQVLRGLIVGDTVVASATFLFDSESQLAAAMAGIMLNMGMGLDMGRMRMEGDNGGEMPGMPMDSAPRTGGGRP